MNPVIERPILLSCACGWSQFAATRASALSWHRRHRREHGNHEIAITAPTITRSGGSLVRGTIEAPRGYVWQARHVHELVAEARGGVEATAAVRADLRAGMALGLQRCDDPGCEWCGEAVQP